MGDWRTVGDAEGYYRVFERADGLRAYVQREEGDLEVRYYVSTRVGGSKGASLQDVDTIQALLASTEGALSVSNSSWSGGTAVVIFVGKRQQRGPTPRSRR
ncbi:MAG: hypothetical protein HYZ28_12180 [Myxococcales bacterium]|nr:hypothetical protein [Myxococcales bacterium]